MWGIAQANGIPLSQLEALNPQIQNPDLILPGESINLGSGGATSSSSSAAPPSGATYTVVHGDTLSGIAQANGISTSQIEALNPQIRDPDLIFPGQSVNLGSGAAVTPTPDPSQPSPVVAAPPASTDTSNSTDSSVTTGSSASSGGGAIGFPNKSSYSSIGNEAAKAGDITLGEKAEAQGWADSSGGATSDIAKNVFEVDSHTSTDPLKINEKK
jgi:LysM repeat protein